ncbi:hypothetical protein GBF38_017188 [Nibea albiflora]|uniref:Uncharacterized protein n=1 Tax=Nibea albiflora TaxID=240163 RepID=A0ACB7EFB2_NIBAL|nr:hypothetical protein GBF38_017188 [Nibea albiflora]
MVPIALLSTVLRAGITERKSCIETLHRDIEKLQEDIRVKQSTVIHNKENAKSMKATNGLLLQYEQRLKEELESGKAGYMRDIVSGQQAIKEPEKQLDPHTEEDSDSSIDISSLHLNQTEISEDGRETSVDANAEKIHKENKDQDASICSPFPGETTNKLWSSQLDEQRCQDVVHAEEEDQETEPRDQVLDSTVSEVEEVVEQEEMEERVAVDEEQAPGKEHNEELAAFPESSPQRTNPQPSPETAKAVSSTATFPFDFSPGRSPHQGTSDTKSPAFLFSLNSEPSTPGFFGLGFDVGPSQDEVRTEQKGIRDETEIIVFWFWNYFQVSLQDSSFAFPGSFFNEKKTTESKSSSSSDFLFGQPEQSEDFQFVFNHKSPQTPNKDNTGDDFPFSFNF